MPRTLFLPGAGGSADFWRPVAERAGLDGVFHAWPGLGDEPPDPGVRGMDDLVARVARDVDRPVRILAQSMGGHVALRTALAFPDRVRALVLVATSGGVPVADLGGADWRADYRAAYPMAAPWITDPVPDLSDRIPAITAPTLLPWRDADPISPVAVGERLLSLLPRARLQVVPGAGHDLARTHVGIVAEAVIRHLAAVA